jgi:hypothetical protein
MVVLAGRVKPLSPITSTASPAEAEPHNGLICARGAARRRVPSGLGPGGDSGGDATGFGRRTDPCRRIPGRAGQRGTWWCCRRSATDWTTRWPRTPI